MSPLKSAMKSPGAMSRKEALFSPTFKEEQVLEKQEAETDKEQAKDLVSFSFSSSFLLVRSSLPFFEMSFVS